MRSGQTGGPDPPRTRTPLPIVVDAGQLHMEDRTDARNGVAPEVAVLRQDGLTGDRQAEAAARVLGRIVETNQRLEDLGEVLRLDADAVVADFENPVPVAPLG